MRETAGADGANATASASLEVVSITKRFGSVTALSDVSMSVGIGEIHGLIGPNGSGKTTLFNLICGQDQPTSGSVNLFGTKSTGRPPETIAEMGIARTFQIPRSFADLTVRDNVRAAAHMHGSVGLVRGMVRLPPTRREERLVSDFANDVLAFVGIEHLAEKRAATLASGHARLLEISRALATRARLVLMDEPAAGLSHYEMERVADLVRDLQRRGISILVVEHNMNFVMSLCDRVSVLFNGTLLAVGTPSEVRADSRVINAYLGTRP
ncbi:MAG: ABC transporter ATP-binding protein [Actinomycetota bacterium]|nr:ABC transporter ATP-binding protein [Actinomycetota bacterium]